MAYSCLHPLLAELLNQTPDRRISEIVAQLILPGQYVVLLPSLESIVTTGVNCATEEFISSHILKILSPPNISSTSNRPPRSKVYFYSTLNSRSVAVKNDTVFTNKGFVMARQAKLMHDRLVRYPNAKGRFIWVQYIDQPLLVTKASDLLHQQTPLYKRNNSYGMARKPVESLQELARLNPVLSQRVMPRVDQLLKHFNDTQAHELTVDTAQIRQNVDQVIQLTVTAFEELLDGAMLRQITDRSGIDGERLGKLIESHVINQVYDLVFYKFTKAFTERDVVLSERIFEMRHLDVHQVGLPFVNSSILSRLLLAIEAFRKFGTARAPNEKLTVLLHTIRVLSGTMTFNAPLLSSPTTEKKNPLDLLSSDYLVPLTILVVLRGNVSNLESNLGYVRDFAYTDLDQGEVGYAVNTMEAAIFHINESYEHLRTVSEANGVFWSAIRDGDLDLLGSFLDLDTDDNLQKHAQIVPENEPQRMRTRSQSLSVDTFFQLRDEEGNSPMHLAIESKQCEVLQLLLSLPVFRQRVVVDQNYKLQSLLILALQSQSAVIWDTVWNVVQSLPPSEIRLAVNKTDENGRAVGHYVETVFKSLEEVGGYIDWAVRDNHGFSPLMSLCRMYDHVEYEHMIQIALQFALSSTKPFSMTDHTDSKGNTLLHVVTAPNFLQKFLELENIDLNAKNAKGHTPMLHWAKYGSNRIELIKLLINDSRCDKYARDHRGFTGLHLAAMKGHTDILQLFAEHINLEDRAGPTGMTALMLAARDSRTSSIAYLMSVGRINPSTFDIRNIRAIDYAVKESSEAQLDTFMLFSLPIIDDRVTGVLRLIGQEHATPLMVIKSAWANEESSTISASRTAYEFAVLSHWLKYEHPASCHPVPLEPTMMLPALSSTPSKAWSLQLMKQANDYLSGLLAHSTLHTHEILWEFLMLQDFDVERIAQRSKQKMKAKRLADEYEPVQNLEEVETFFSHSLITLQELCKAYERANKTAASVEFCQSGMQSMG